MHERVVLSPWMYAVACKAGFDMDHYIERRPLPTGGGDMSTINEQTTELAIQAAGKTAPRLRPQDIDRVVTGATYHVFHGVLTVCVLTLANGYLVTGESACASPENYNKEIGEGLSYQNARSKVWALEGYLLRERLSKA